MATEFNTRPGGGLQWRDRARGVDGWNNIDNSDPNTWPPGYKPPASAAKPAAAAPKPAAASAAAPAPVSAGGGGTPAASAPPSMAALNKVATPTPGAVTADATPPSMAGIMGDSGGGGSAGVLGTQQGALRPLGRRLMPQDSMALAGLQRRVY